MFLLGVLAVEDGCEAGCGDKGGCGLLGQVVGKVPGLRLEVLETDLHKLVVSKGAVQGRHHSVRYSLMANHDHRVQALGLASEFGPCLACHITLSWHLSQYGIKWSHDIYFFPSSSEIYLSLSIGSL